MIHLWPSANSCATLHCLSNELFCALHLRIKLANSCLIKPGRLQDVHSFFFFNNGILRRGVNICIAPQWCPCRCVCWVVCAHWVKTPKYDSHQLIHSESINTPQLILGEGEALQFRLWFCLEWYQEVLYCSPPKPHPLYPPPPVSSHLSIRSDPSEWSVLFRRRCHTCLIFHTNVSPIEILCYKSYGLWNCSSLAITGEKMTIFFLEISLGLLFFLCSGYCISNFSASTTLLNLYSNY